VGRGVHGSTGALLSGRRGQGHVDDRPREVLATRSDSGHHRSWRRRWLAPWGMSELKIWERWQHGLTAATTEVEDIHGGPPRGCCQHVRQRTPPKLKTSIGGPELEIRERSAFGARPSGRAMNGCRNLETNAQRVVRMHFTLTQVGHFCRRFSWGLDMLCAPLSGVGNSSRLPTHVPNSKTRPRHSDPPLMVKEAPKEQTRPIDT
jgi:hypothetical protein